MSPREEGYGHLAPNKRSALVRRQLLSDQLPYARRAKDSPAIIWQAWVQRTRCPDAGHQAPTNPMVPSVFPEKIISGVSASS